MEDEIQSEICSRMNKGNGVTRSQNNIRSSHNDDSVKFQIYNIERKINKANEKRQEQMSSHLQKSAGYQSKVE